MKMQSPHNLLFFLCVPLGCVSSARLIHVSGFEGREVNVSCPYGGGFETYEKYLCKNDCGNAGDVLITTTQGKTNRYSVCEDKRRRIFKVTISDLRRTDTGTYWCGVTRTFKDVFPAEVKLEVLPEWCCVKSKKLSGTVGRPGTMQCPYPPQHRHNRKFLCKGDHRNNCTDMVTSQSRFTLQDDVSSSSFTVLITKLRAGDAGTYWCGSDSQWTAADYTQIQLSLVVPPLTSTVTPDITVEPVTSQSTRIPGKHIKDISFTHVLVFIVLAVLLILAFTLVILSKCHRKGPEVNLSRNTTKTVDAEEMVYEVQGDVACSVMGSSKQQSMLYHNKSSEVLVSRPHYDSRAVAQGAPERESPVEPDVPQPSSGSATAGYRSAKYSPAEWFNNYHSILQQAGTDQHEARSIQRESKTLYQNTEAVTLKTQAEGTRLLGERLQEIHYWKSELQRHIEQLRADTEALLALKTRLEKALDATETPYAIATDNLNCRTRRLGPDLVRDTVEEELLKEVDLIRSIQALLKRTTAQVVSQIKMNREAKQTLELDWSDKHQAYNLDDQSGRYTNLSPDTRHHPSSAAVQDQVSNCTSWTKFTQDNLSKAMQEEQATNSLRVLVERVLQDTTEDLRVQCSTVDQAFSQRCTELIEAKTQLEIRLAETLEQIGAQERNIVALQQAIHNKEAPLRVAQSRLYTRSLRPNMELCRDEPQFSLEAEVRQIDATLASLHQQLSEARGSLSHLEESRINLEKDINCKTHSLFIDRDKCMTHRKRYPAVSTLSGY